MGFGNATNMQMMHDKIQMNGQATKNAKPKFKPGEAGLGSIKTTKQGYDILHFNYKQEPKTTQEEVEIIKQMNE